MNATGRSVDSMKQVFNENFKKIEEQEKLAYVEINNVKKNKRNLDLFMTATLVVSIAISIIIAQPFVFYIIGSLIIPLWVPLRSMIKINNDIYSVVGREKMFYSDVVKACDLSTENVDVIHAEIVLNKISNALRNIPGYGNPNLNVVRMSLSNRLEGWKSLSPAEITPKEFFKREVLAKQSFIAGYTSFFEIFVCLLKQKVDANYLILNKKIN